jgi:hypothetical protein
VTLTKGQFAIVDLDDLHLVEPFNWFCDKQSGGRLYAARHSPRDANGKQQFIMMHRVILGVPQGVLVDHEDGNGLNNRRSNLRPANTQQNKANSKLPRNNTSGFKGVSLHRPSGKWFSRIKVDDKLIHLGVFDDPAEAGAAYEAAAKQQFGEFARMR